MAAPESGDQAMLRAYGAFDSWHVAHVPAANTTATITKPAGAAGVKHVAQAITVTLAAGTSAPAAVNVSVSLIDGAAGGTTYRWRATLSLPAVAGECKTIALSGMDIIGTAATAMTLEFSAAGGANTIESVSLIGRSVS